MRLARYVELSGPAGSADALPPLPFASVNDDDTVSPAVAEGLRYRRSASATPLREVRLLEPVRPGKVVAVGLNYRSHVAEMGDSLPQEPLLFLKPPSAVIGPGEAILLPAASRRVDHEAELAVVIGRQLQKASPQEARQAILGYTCANDVTARDLQHKDGQWTRAKSFDTFCPLGPWIETEVDPTALEVLCRVNGALRQRGNTRDMAFGVYDLVAFISGVMTLFPGDVVLTGTPAGISHLQPGDRVEVQIEGIGVLRNPVAKE